MGSVNPSQLPKMTPPPPRPSPLKGEGVKRLWFRQAFGLAHKHFWRRNKKACPMGKARRFPFLPARATNINHSGF